MGLKLNLTKILYSLVIIFFVFFCFFDLNWGAPFYFHPDERNVASSISQLKFPENLNPNFYAYGALPIYIVYFLFVFLNFLFTPLLSQSVMTINLNVSFEQAIILGRILSAFLTVATVFLIYKTTKDFFGKAEARLAAFFGLTSVGYLQYSHFGTFEIWLSFFSLLLVFLFALYLKSKNKIFFIAGACIFGILCGLKASSLFLLPIPIYIICIKIFEQKTILRKIKTAIFLSIVIVLTASLFYIISSPFNLIKYKSFIGTLNYEKNVALGETPVFYTGSFYNTIPIVYQYTKVLPFLINPLLTLISLPTIVVLSYIFIRKRDIYLGLVLVAFFTLFLSQSYLFVKWSRYIIPSISFLYILIAVFLLDIKQRLGSKIFTAAIIFIAAVALLFAFSFLYTVRLSEDTRVEAKNFAVGNIPPDSQILSEVYDLGIVPFNNGFNKITLFDFYALDNVPGKELELSQLQDTFDYIILPSDRIYKSRTVNSNKFPAGDKFYTNLFSQKSGFQKIYETPCDIFCKIVYLGDPVFNIEETANVFDHPTFFIFKKND